MKIFPYRIDYEVSWIDDYGAYKSEILHLIEWAYTAEDALTQGRVRIGKAKIVSLRPAIATDTRDPRERLRNEERYGKIGVDPSEDPKQQ